MSPLLVLTRIWRYLLVLRVIVHALTLVGVLGVAALPLAAQLVSSSIGPYTTGPAPWPS